MNLSPQRPQALSPSRAADYRSCPLKYRFRVIDRIPEPPAPAAVRGILVHAVLEKLFSAAPTKRTPQLAHEQLPEIWQAMVAQDSQLADLVSPQELPAWIAGAHDLVNRYFELENPQYLSPQACELRLEVTLPTEVPTRGFIDRLEVNADGLMRIVDYKTGRAPAAAYHGEALFQLKFYALMMYRLRGIVPAQLLLLYLGNGQRLTYSPTEQELLQFEVTLTELWQAIIAAVATGNFPPRTSRLCDWCSFKNICPAFGGTPPPYPLVTS